MKVKQKPPSIVRTSEEVEEILECLQQKRVIEASPYFQSKLLHRLKEEAIPQRDWLYRFTQGYRMVPVWLSLIIVINIVSLAMTLSSTDSQHTTDNKLRSAANELFSFPGGN